MIHQRLSEDETLEDRTTLTPGQITHFLELCLKTTYFCFREEYHQQKDGAAMGSPVSPVVANIYMEMFEEMALSTTQQKPRIWKRYVDDTFCVMEEERVSSLLEHHQPPWKLKTTRAGLPFPDTLLKRREDGGLDISVYGNQHTPIGTCNTRHITVTPRTY